ncbi:MAG: pyridoxine 5'-phosphate synthase [Candidatus Puniceispirillaceae bacterium]
MAANLDWFFDHQQPQIYLVHQKQQHDEFPKHLLFAFFLNKLLHTGRYCHDVSARDTELTRIAEAAVLAESLGLECHAGHGLDYETVGAVAAIPQMQELNIGHFLMGESLFVGFDAAIGQMRLLMDEARSS